MSDFIPGGNVELLGFANNYSDYITAHAVAVGLTSTIATTLAGLTTSYETKLDALETPTNRNSVSTLEMQEARRDLVSYIRQTARVIQACMTVTDAVRTTLRLPLRDGHRVPAEQIDVAPALTVLDVFGHNVRIRIRQAGSTTSRAKLPAADGCLIYSFVGEAPPADYSKWASEGQITKDSVIVAFPSTVPALSKVWLAAAWYNTKGSGPGCTPVMTAIGVEGSSASGENA